MKKSKILEFEGRKPKKRVKYSLVIDILDVNNDTYLIADLYLYKNKKYRIAIGSTDYIHYDYDDESWDKKTEYNMPYRAEIRHSDITAEDYSKIKRFTKKARCKVNTYISLPPALDYITALEFKIQSEKEKAKEEREEKERQELFKLLPEVPNVLREKIQSHINEDNIIYYKREGNRADYKCCQCGKEFTRRFYRNEEPDMQFMCGKPIIINPPYKFKSDKCDMCGCSAQLLQRGHAKTYVQEFNTLLYQTAEDGTLIVRGFYTIANRNEYNEMNASTREYGVMFLKRGMVRSYHNYISSNKWYRNRHITLESHLPVYAIAYDKAVESSDLKYIPRDMYGLTINKNTETERNTAKMYALVSYANAPQLETLYKIGLSSICRHLLWNLGISREINKKAADAAGILRISRQQFKLLMEYSKDKNDKNEHEIIQFANKYNIPMEQYFILRKLIFYCGKYNLAYCLKFQSLKKIFNLINKYKKDYNNSLMMTLTEYADYLREREAAGDDMTNTVVLRPRNLHETYTRVRMEAQQRRDKDYMDKVCDKYSDISKRSKQIPKKYTWQQSGLIIRPAESAQEIVMEGRILHHCVGSENQRYLKNYNDGKAWIMVIRHEDKTDEPFVTVELEDNKVKQWYGAYDKKPDAEHVDKFLEEYIEHVKGKVRDK